MPTIERKPFIPLTEFEQQAFCRTDDSLEVKPLSEEFSAAVSWQSIPSEYHDLGGAELSRRIAVARNALGKKLVILGHHYQRDEIIQFADYRGDSLKLSQQAAAQQEAEFIIFCGVHFMAETADILTSNDQKVILPNITAGCSMADMAPTDDVVDCWDDLVDMLGGENLIPITYMNSTAAIKALCGRNGGIVCTSSNALAVLEWAYNRGERIVFFPDQHLGRNTCLRLGIQLDEIVVWNPFKPLGGNSLEQLRKSKAIVWQGHCSVHTRFSVAQIKKARLAYPDINVIVHPECVMETVQQADSNGSTEFIIDTINRAPAGSKWAVGTEISLVNRIASENPDKTVFCLDSVVCPCSTMYRTHPAYLLWTLEKLVNGEVINQISVDEETAHYARIALDRMLKEV